MTRRIELQINPSGHPKGVTWSIYRSTSPSVPMDNEHLIAKVKESEAITSLEIAKGDVLEPSPYDPFLFLASHRYVINPEPILYIDDAPVPRERITFFPGEREVRVIDERLSIGNSCVLKMDYTYSSVNILDDKRPQSGVEYIGPVALGLKAIHDQSNFEGMLDWEHDVTGMDYYYRMVARDGDKKSEDSVTKGIFLEQDEVKIRYRIERAPTPSTPEEDWEYLGTAVTTMFIDGQPASDFPWWVLDKNEVTLEKIADDKVRIRLRNPFFKQKRHSWCYRIAPIDECGEKGPWEYILPQEMDGEIKLAKIRRYRYNKLPASFDGIEDGLDIKVWESATGEVLEFVDTYMDPLNELLPKEFGYTFYVRDQWGYHSLPIYRAISLDTGEILE